MNEGLRRILSKKFWGFPCTADFLRCEMPTVLRMRGFLACKLSFRLLCQNRCTVRREQMPHKACKGHWEFRYHLNFIWQPAQIHIHVQMCLAGTSLYQRCPLPDEIPGAPNSPYQASVLWRTVSRFCSNMEKTVFIVKRKTNHLERWYFIIRKTVSWNTAKLLYRQLLSPFAIA